MSNDDQTSAYDVVLADLIARRDQLNAAIAAIEAAKAGGGGKGTFGLAEWYPGRPRNP